MHELVVVLIGRLSTFCAITGFSLSRLAMEMEIFCGSTNNDSRKHDLYICDVDSVRFSGVCWTIVRIIGDALITVKS